MNSTIRRQADRVWLEDVKGGSFRERPAEQRIFPISRDETSGSANTTAGQELAWLRSTMNHHAAWLLFATLGSVALCSCSTPMKTTTPSKHPMRAADLTSASASTEPRIVRREKFLVMGTLTRIAPGTETGEKFASIWNEFEAHRGRIQPHSTDQKYYGVSFAIADEAGFEYLAGMATTPAQAVPAGFVIREVPAATYAVFACPAPAIGPTKHYIFGQWRSQSGCQVDNSAPAFEQYPPEGSTESPVLIHIPIREGPVK